MKRIASTAHLPCPLIKEAEGLYLDPDNAEDGALATVPPYNAMKVNDKVTFNFTTSKKPYTNTKILAAADIGKPLHWTVPYASLWPNEGSQAIISYSINYADTSLPGSTSAGQTIFINNFAAIHLPEVTFDNFSGSEISPGSYPDGLMIAVPWWTEADPQTTVAVYIRSQSTSNKVTLTQNLDASNIDSQKISVQFHQSDLNNFINDTLMITYQFSKTGNSATSQSRSIKVVKPLNLPLPAFDKDHVTPGNPGSGSSEAIFLTEGLPVSVPSEAETGSHNIEMCCEGGVAAQSFVLPAQAARDFTFPAAMVAANMGHGCDIFYRIAQPADGSRGEESARYRLTINKIPPTQFPAASCQYATGTQLSLRQIATDTVIISLAKWGFMAAGQLVNVIISGTSHTGVVTNEMVLDAHTVTNLDVGNAVTGTIKKSFFQSLKLQEQFSITSRVSFDQGETFIPFQATRLTLVN